MKVESERGEGVEEDGGELVHAVEHQAVLPDYNGQHEDTHTEDIVGLRGTKYRVSQKKGGLRISTS